MPVFEVVALLLPFGSVSVADAEALRTAVPVPVAVRLIVCVAVLVFDNVPIEQVIGFEPLQVPCVDDGEPLRVTLAGRVIVAVTFEAVCRAVVRDDGGVGEVARRWRSSPARCR